MSSEMLALPDFLLRAAAPPSFGTARERAQRACDRSPRPPEELSPDDPIRILHDMLSGDSEDMTLAEEKDGEIEDLQSDLDSAESALADAQEKLRAAEEIVFITKRALGLPDQSDEATVCKTLDDLVQRAAAAPGGAR